MLKTLNMLKVFTFGGDIPAKQEVLGDDDPELSRPSPKIESTWSYIKKIRPFIKDPCESCLVEPTCSKQCEKFHIYNENLHARVNLYVVFLNTRHNIKEKFLDILPGVYFGIGFSIVIMFAFFMIWLCKTQM